jgi:hypothetical protein
MCLAINQQNQNIFDKVFFSTQKGSKSAKIRIVFNIDICQSQTEAHANLLGITLLGGGVDWQNVCLQNNPKTNIYIYPFLLLFPLKAISGTNKKPNKCVLNKFKGTYVCRASFSSKVVKASYQETDFLCRVI